MWTRWSAAVSRAAGMMAAGSDWRGTSSSYPTTSVRTFLAALSCSAGSVRFSRGRLISPDPNRRRIRHNISTERNESSFSNGWHFDFHPQNLTNPSGYIGFSFRSLEILWCTLRIEMSRFGLFSSASPPPVLDVSLPTRKKSRFRSIVFLQFFIIVGFFCLLWQQCWPGIFPSVLIPVRYRFSPSHGECYH